jgi:acyl-CoA synthetase (AMP-forming)/AMP-acid ligase II
MTTLVEWLERAERHAECGLRLLDRNEKESWLGWPELCQRARQVAGALHALGIQRHETVGLFYPTGRDFFAAFFGTLLAGAVPVPFYPPVRLGRLGEYQNRTSAMLKAASVRIVLADTVVRRVVGEAVAAARCHGYTLAQLPNGKERVEAVGEEDLALIQFSSGTTVDPKPVALTHRAITAQVQLLNNLWPDRPAAPHSGVSWLPLYHDMGLIGCVLPALERPGVLTLISPEAFVAHPALWLRAISRYRATLSPAPNFAYRLCLEKIKDADLDGVDLSCWEVAMNGAEMVAPRVLRAFIERFGRWGFRPEAMTPVYGLSEAALAVTFSSLGERFVSRRFLREALIRRGEALPAEEGVELASVGQPLPGFDIEIRNEANEREPDRHVGHVWVRGPSLMKEYLNNPVATARALQDGWLDTGDLGFMHDGQLYITGRAKDILIIRGFNHAPEEIELVVDDLPGVRTGCRAAVSHLPEGADREEVWLFVERHRQAGRDQTGAIAESCRRAVLSHTGIILDRVEVLEPGTLPRTSSGKIRRQEALHQFLAGELKSPNQVTTLSLLKAVGRSMLAERRMAKDPAVRDDRPA